MRIPRIAEHVLPVGTLPRAVLPGPSKGPNLMSDRGRDDDGFFRHRNGSPDKLSDLLNIIETIHDRNGAGILDFWGCVFRPHTTSVMKESSSESGTHGLGISFAI